MCSSVQCNNVFKYSSLFMNTCRYDLLSFVQLLDLYRLSYHLVLKQTYIGCVFCLGINIFILMTIKVKKFFNLFTAYTIIKKFNQLIFYSYDFLPSNLPILLLFCCNIIIFCVRTLIKAVL